VGEEWTREFGTFAIEEMFTSGDDETAVVLLKMNSSQPVTVCLFVVNHIIFGYDMT
jgi:hypothetical protein